MATPWQPFSCSLGACADLSSSFSLQVRARAVCGDEEKIVLSFGIFWSVLVTMAAIFFCWGLKKRRSWRLNDFETTSYGQESEFSRCEIQTPMRIRQVRNVRISWSRQWGKQSLSSSFSLLCKHLFSFCDVSRKPNVDLIIFRSHVIRCSLVSLAACFSFSSWWRRLIPVTVAETAAKNRHLAASGHLRFLFFFKKKRSLYWHWPIKTP